MKNSPQSLIPRGSDAFWVHNMSLYETPKSLSQIFIIFSPEMWQVIVLGKIGQEIALSPFPRGCQTWDKWNQ
jgi:hypothetical protein